MLGVARGTELNQISSLGLVSVQWNAKPGVLSLAPAHWLVLTARANVTLFPNRSVSHAGPILRHRGH